MSAVPPEKSRKFASWRLETLGVRVDLFLRNELPELGLPARIADHRRASPDDRENAVAVPLQVSERHDRDETPRVEAVRGRIEADVAGDALLEHRADLLLVGDLFDESALLQHVVDAGHGRSFHER